jgi:hypothetical protein
MRTSRMLSLAESRPGFPGLDGGKTYAAWPVWSGSFRNEVHFAPLPKKKALNLYHKARAWNRQKLAGRYGGTLGSAAMRVLECLIFDFLNFATGRLDPGYQAIARKTGMSRSTIATALARLKNLGILHWVRRCSEGRGHSGRFLLRQETNAYAILPASQWRGHDQQPEPPHPHPSTWGACPPLPPLIDQAITEQEHGRGVPAIIGLLESDPADRLAIALARLGRSLHRPKH